LLIIRQTRKLDHIKYALQMDDPFGDNGFSDIHLIHQSLPELAFEEVDPATVFLNKKIAAPLLINAMTGGNKELAKINQSMARIARKTRIAMAVGSQKAGLEDPELRFTYTIAREENPDGVLLANLSASCLPEEADAAVEMIKADGMQLFLNAPQELVMEEGERDFRHILRNIRAIQERVRVPVIVKEVGFGMSKETITRLYEAGVRYVDVGGSGGTNFIYIENCRQQGKDSRSEITHWGIPTAISLLEGLSLQLPVSFIASGGITSVLEAAKALALGGGSGRDGPPASENFIM